MAEGSGAAHILVPTHRQHRQRYKSCSQAVEYIYNINSLYWYYLMSAVSVISSLLFSNAFMGHVRRLLQIPAAGNSLTYDLRWATPKCDEHNSKTRYLHQRIRFVDHNLAFPMARCISQLSLVVGTPHNTVEITLSDNSRSYS
ncbi:hypothetical protein GGR58DRAFT_226208 [Xylaria digitata]|nr:hypothetical protein GGR58DRAFT_226208 [Xylaria digitata]